ncbi:MAG TPA: hypothetical protein EYO45_03345 [Candidatus Marinimicrobia bacterium]|nr:hypothetical protein [Candidatus Neomarinimicrobiota bacterium]
MRPIYIYTIIFVSISTVFGSINAFEITSSESLNNWIVLQNDATWIGWTDHSGFPVCQTRATFPYPMKKISNIIEDIENYPNVFKRITMARILDDDIAHVVLDMPFPFSSRDYIIQFVMDKSHTYWIFNFKAVTHNDAPVNDKYVRLLNAAGEWLIKPISNNETAIAYTWNGELLGDFPSWALPRAWKTQGNEIIDWLNEALSN